MAWIADLHIHSHYSMATSKDCTPRNLYRWAGLKGVALVGTGDFTHPGWRKELSAELLPAEPGFYTLKEPPLRELPDAPAARFVVSGELSSIYKKNGKVRKVHNLIILPSLEAADRIAVKLEELGLNIRSDGRPIIGMDSRDLLELVLNLCPEAIFIPAHIWTPHFSVFGSNSGFDSIEDCFEDLTSQIYALETGLSSDPAMNWRWSALDRFTLVSNSDAHNPQNLAREANLFTAEFSYDGMREALRNKAAGNFAGTLEFFPEEGKYHYDGHRNCGIAWHPEETLAQAGICPVCGKKVTIGVLHRVIALADRETGFQPKDAAVYQSLVPLREVIGSAFGKGAGSRKVEQCYFDLLHKFGPELTVLRDAPLEEIIRIGGPLVSEGLRRLRAGKVGTQPGYDGEYGAVSVLNESDRLALQGQAALFETAAAGGEVRNTRWETQLQKAVAGIVDEARSMVTEAAIPEQKSDSSGEQRRIIHSDAACLIVIAGPGTGKTRTLVERIAYLVREAGAGPEEITGVTFTNKAAVEIRNRLQNVLAGDKRVQRLNLGTFHGLAWRILNRNPEYAHIKLLEETETREIIEDVLRKERIPMTAREASLIISLMKNKYLWEPEAALPPQMIQVYRSYQESLEYYGRWDFDDLMIRMVEAWEADQEWLAPYKNQFHYLLIDEFQDLNPIQYRLVKLWAKDCRHLMVIGDPNQAIYGFRGATPKFFDALRQDYPDAQTLQLTRNYRSSAAVIKAANHLVEPVYRQNPPEPEGEEYPQQIFWFETPGEKMAGKAIVAEILNLLGGANMLTAHGQALSAAARIAGSKRKITGNLYGFNDFAILYRTARQIDALEEALSVEGLPYRVVGQKNTLEAGAVKEFLSFFRYLLHPEDLFLFRTVLRTPRWGFSRNEIEQVLHELSTVSKQPLTEGLAGTPGLPEQLTNKLSQFQAVAEYYRSKLELRNQALLEDWMLRMDLTSNEELEHLRRIGEQYRNIREMLEFFPLAQEADIIRYGNKMSGTEAITLSSLHAAKGLEFPVVFISGVEEGLLPWGDDPDTESVAEEERLFYVGVTRAKHRLYLVSSQFRSRHGNTEQVRASRFLERIPPELLAKEEWNRQSKKLKQLELF